VDALLDTFWEQRLKILDEYNIPRNKWESAEVIVFTLYHMFKLSTNQNVFIGVIILWLELEAKLINNVVFIAWCWWKWCSIEFNTVDKGCLASS